MPNTPEEINALISSKLEESVFNPYATAALLLSHAENALGNKVKIVDPSNPFIFLLDAAIATSNAAATTMFNLNRSEYPKLAKTHSDLYNHISDIDYLSIFALPSDANISFLVSYDEFNNRSIHVPGENYRQVKMSRYSEITAGDVSFTLVYPVVIREYNDGSVVVFYDTSIQDKLQTVSSKLIKSNLIRDAVGESWIMFTINIKQFTLRSTEYDINKSTVFKHKIQHMDNYYYVRVYNKSNKTDRNWVELPTTHSRYIYDTNVPTALINVLGNVVEVEIPLVYTNTDMITGTIRVDLFDTKGNIYYPLKERPINDFSIKYIGLDGRLDTDEYTAVMPNITTRMFSTDVVHGGKNVDNFDTIKQRVIDNTVGMNKFPITESQLKERGRIYNYDIIKLVDLVTDRWYSASRHLPNTNSSNISIVPDLTYETLLLTLNEADLYDNIHKFNNGYIIKSNTAFSVDNGIVKPINKNSIDSLPIVDRVNYINSNSIFYNPFYYLVIIRDTHLISKVYSLDYPEITNRNAASTNLKLKIHVSTDKIYFQRCDDGYQILVKTISDSKYKEIDNSDLHAQLAIKIPNSDYYGYVDGEIIGDRDGDTGEVVFQFKLNTQFEFNENNQIYITNLKSVILKTLIDLKTEGTIYYYTTSENLEATPLYTINSEVFSGEVEIEGLQVITKETMDISIGDHLEYIWNGNRMSYNENKYRRYEADVYDVYPNDIFSKDPTTGASFSVDPDCNITFTLLYRKGDYKLNPDGSYLLKHRKGDVMLDHNGNPIIDRHSGITTHIDLMLVEGEYLFANSDDNIQYRKEMNKLIATWVLKDMVRLNEELLEMTRIFYNPVKTTGKVKVSIGNDSYTYIDTKQNLNVVLYVTKETYDSTSLKTNLILDTELTLRELLRRVDINMTVMRKELLENLGNAVSGAKVELSGYDNGESYEYIKVLDLGKILSIKKELYIDSDNKLRVSSGMNISFVVI